MFGSLNPTWIEHATFWSGVRRATIAPRIRMLFRLKYTYLIIFNKLEEYSFSIVVWPFFNNRSKTYLTWYRACVITHKKWYSFSQVSTILSKRRKMRKKCPIIYNDLQWISLLLTQWRQIANSRRRKDLDSHHWSLDVTLMKISSGQGIVKPPIGWSNPNSSSDLLRSAWNEGWVKYEIGTTYLFFWLSPTYTARNPFGAAEAVVLLVEAAVTDRPRIFFAPNRLLTKAISILCFLKVWILLKRCMKRLKLLDCFVVGWW